ncbi:MAG: hypothetical protein DRN49_03045 [Thaumarchaeota archaeon]|nr:MAG: hypothetical protein DRN49_03045 [Nitrososphaerota archaeon]
MEDVTCITVPEAAWADSRTRVLKFPKSWNIEVYPMKGYLAPALNREKILYSLRNPIHAKPLRKIAEGKREVAIIFDDNTRPTKVGEIAKIVIEELKSAGIKDDNIRFIAALGAHGAMNKADFLKKLGSEIADEYAVYNHNPFHGCEHLGETSQGTPIEVNGEYVSCDLRIGIGCIVPHPMMGFGGGAKILLPGIASMKAIEYNHANVGGYVGGLTPHPSTGWGRNIGNILREDCEEFARIAKIDFKIDVLINGFNDSIDIYSGDVVEEQRTGAEKGREIYSSEIPADYDAIILNTSAKANEAALALSNWYPFISENAIVVVIANPPGGQVTHYAYGKFGKNIGGSIFNPGKPLEKIKQLIWFSEHPEVDPLFPIARPGEIQRIKSWNEVIEEVSSLTGKRDIRVAVIPNADVQCPSSVLKPL